jgi:5-methylcytosine-specific restriction endonuclease McrA
MASVEQVKPLTQEHSKISFLVDQEFMDQLEEATGLLASKMPGASVSEVLGEVMKLGLSVLRKKRFKLIEDQGEDSSGEEEPREETPKLISGVGIQPNAKSKSSAVSSVRSNPNTDVGTKSLSTPKPPQCKPVSDVGTQSPKTNKPERSRYIPASVQRQVRLRDGNKCVNTNPKTGERCGSRYDIQFDHFPIPFATGGENSVENLRLVCRACNLLHGVQRFGRDKIAAY